MFLGLGMGNRERDQSITTCWPKLQVGFKLFFILSLVVSLVSMFYSPLLYYLPNLIEKTVESFQLWRLISSFLVNGTGLMAILNTLFCFYMLYITLPDTERKYSTAYSIFQVIIQLFISNVTVVLIGYPLYYLEVLSSDDVIGYGMLPIVMNFLWQTVARNPQQQTRFCCFPCLIPIKYVPWCFTGLICLIGGSIVPNLIYCLLGYYQHLIRKRSLLPLPLSVYRKFDVLMPNFIITNKGFVKVLTVEPQLRPLCSNGCCGDLLSSQSQIANDMINRVQVIGGGTVIGGSDGKKKVDQKAFKSHWEKKEFQQQQNNQQQLPQKYAQQQSVQKQQPQQIVNYKEVNLVNLSDEMKQSGENSDAKMQPRDQVVQYEEQVEEFQKQEEKKRHKAQQQKEELKKTKNENTKKHYPLVEEQDFENYS